MNAPRTEVLMYAKGERYLRGLSARFERYTTMNASWTEVLMYTKGEGYLMFCRYHGDHGHVQFLSCFIYKIRDKPRLSDSCRIKGSWGIVGLGRLIPYRMSNLTAYRMSSLTAYQTVVSLPSKVASLLLEALSS